MRYAIVPSGGKQYVAREGQSLEVDRLDSATGQTIEFSEVLLVADGGQVMGGAPSGTDAPGQGAGRHRGRGPPPKKTRPQARKNEARPRPSPPRPSRPPPNRRRANRRRANR